MKLTISKTEFCIYSTVVKYRDSYHKLFFLIYILLIYTVDGMESLWLTR